MSGAVRSHVELDIRPSLEFVGSVRRFVSDVYDQLVRNQDAASRIGVASHELLENAVRCSADGSVLLRIEINRENPSDMILVTRNRARTDDLATLQALVDEMRTAPDPLTHYMMLMRRNARRTSGSGLGLARIRAECDLDVVVSLDGDLVTIVATGRPGAAA
jgi:hypothetical protein